MKVSNRLSGYLYKETTKNKVKSRVTFFNIEHVVEIKYIYVIVKIQ